LSGVEFTPANPPAPVTLWPPLPALDVALIPDAPFTPVPDVPFTPEVVFLFDAQLLRTVTLNSNDQRTTFEPELVVQARS
jgi:hypothetical protein